VPASSPGGSPHDQPASVLLPKYPGLDTYARVLESGDATFGASVHLGSGSAGNAVVVDSGGARVLLDAGFSCRAPAAG
jgi:folate-dependent phosphoribosylglycinamide formyltransferase PurN